MSSPVPTLEYGGDLPSLPGRDPHTAPSQFIRRADDGGFEIVEARRPSRLLLVTKIREQVDDWRQSGYQNASSTTRRLFQYWFEEEPDPTFRLYWGQREAIETVVYLTEVLGHHDVGSLVERFIADRDATLIDEPYRIETTTTGQRQLVLPEAEGDLRIYPLPPPDVPRVALKMATGSGKTMVMAHLVAWSYFHARREPGSAMADNFLVVAPNVIVFDRLRLDFEGGKVFRNYPLVPPSWRFELNVILRGDATEPGAGGALFVTNIQQLYETERPLDPVNAVQKLLGRRPTGDPARGRKVIDRLRDIERLMVLNDEAHHVHDDDLEWNRTLLRLHDALPQGLSQWVDVSATPRFQNGAHFPWIVCDYPLAQAVEDRIVKAPVILHLVDKPQPDKVTRAQVLDKYGPWLLTGMERLRQHEKTFKHFAGAKPVLFVMCESVQHADIIGRWFREQHGVKDEHVLIIHTKGDGEVRDSDLGPLREAARTIDEPDSPTRIVVSVLVLREGWDVKNVTIVLGLRPGTAAAQILPEQAVGRGLRLMREVGPDRQQILEVMGTPAFEDFVKQLEAEGVAVPITTKPPKAPIQVYPVRERVSEFDIAIPRTGPRIYHAYTRLDEVDTAVIPAVFTAADVDQLSKIRIQVKEAIHEVGVGEISVELTDLPLAQDIVSAIASAIQSQAGFTGEFATLVPIVSTYLEKHAFGQKTDLGDEATRRFFHANPGHRERVVTQLASALANLISETKPLVIEASPIRLSETPRFQWRRQHAEAKKTVFNVVATFNDFESDFGEFLDTRPDIVRFSALAETFTGFSVDYLKPSGAIGRYYPDWVAVQEGQEDFVNWIIETKGRVFEGTEQKDAAIRHWCESVTESSGERWEYMRVDQGIFAPGTWPRFADLVSFMHDREATVRDMVIFQTTA